MVREGILTEDTADKIRAFYASKEKGGGNRLFLVFGVLGSLLVGLGLFLILAHNWDDLSVGIKTVVAFLPLLLGLAASGYSLVKKADSPSWREGSGVFLFLAVGVCLALLQQIHNLPDTTGQFMLKWMLMGVPIAYVLGSSMSSILYFLGIIWIGFEYGAQLSNSWEDALFWPMALLGLPFG